MNNLWSDGRSEDDCAGIPNDELVYNLFEDIRCLKEEVEIWKKMYWSLSDANQQLVEAVKPLVK